MSDELLSKIDAIIESIPPSERGKLPICYADFHGRNVELLTSMDSFHSEHIQGEGADIGIYRAFDGGHICGAHLPWYPEYGHVEPTVSKLKQGILCVWANNETRADCGSFTLLRCKEGRIVGILIHGDDHA